MLKAISAQTGGQSSPICPEPPTRALPAVSHRGRPRDKSNYNTFIAHNLGPHQPRSCGPLWQPAELAQHTLFGIQVKDLYSCQRLSGQPVLCPLSLRDTVLSRPERDRCHSHAVGTKLHGLQKCRRLKLDLADKVRPGTKCRKCGTWWPQETNTGKGKGQGHGKPRDYGHGKTTWPRKPAGDQLLDSPPGLSRLRPLKQNKEQSTAAELLATTWDVIPEPIQTKLQALGPTGGTGAHRATQVPHDSAYRML